MNEIKKQSAVWWILLLIGIVCAVILVAQRCSAKQSSRYVAAAIYNTDIEQLSRAGGQSKEYWLQHLSEAGVSYVVYSETNHEAPSSDLGKFGLKAAWAGMSCDDSTTFLIPNKVSSSFRTDAPIAVIEDFSRTGITTPASISLDSYGGPVVKAWKMEDYQRTYGAADGRKNVENHMYIAATDRGMRIIILRPFEVPLSVSPNGKPITRIVTDPSDYSAVLGGLKARLAGRGLTFGRDFSVLNAKPFNPVLTCGCSFIGAALWILLLGRCFKIPKKTEIILCAVSAAALAAAYAFLPQLAQKGMMLLTALAFSLIGIAGLFRAADGENGALSKIPAIPSYIAALAGVVLWCVFGGLTVAALMSSRVYMLGGAIFSGVKLSELLPMAAALVLLAKFLASQLRSESPGFNRRTLLRLVIVAFVVAAVGYLFVKRSGDVHSLSRLESWLRSFLENNLYARPRTKEMLIAVPSIALFIWARKNKKPILGALFGLAASIECVSVINTFCHAVTPVKISVVRTLLGAGIGMILGIAAVGIFTLLFKLAGRAKKEAGLPAGVS